MYTSFIFIITWNKWAAQVVWICGYTSFLFFQCSFLFFQSAPNMGLLSPRRPHPPDSSRARNSPSDPCFLSVPFCRRPPSPGQICDCWGLRMLSVRYTKIRCRPCWFYQKWCTGLAMNINLQTFGVMQHARQCKANKCMQMDDSARARNRPTAHVQDITGLWIWIF